jgi:hypothetical protein
MRWIMGIGIVGVVLLFTWPGIYPQALRSEAAADAQLISPGFHYPIEVVLESLQDMPKDGIHGVIVARTTVRRASDGACVIHLTEESLRYDRLTIAHETAHCVLQHEYLQENGYVAWVTQEMVWKFEEDAKSAARVIVGREAER